METSERENKRLASESYRNESYDLRPQASSTNHIAAAAEADFEVGAF